MEKRTHAESERTRRGASEREARAEERNAAERNGTERKEQLKTSRQNRIPAVRRSMSKAEATRWLALNEWKKKRRGEQEKPEREANTRQDTVTATRQDETRQDKTRGEERRGDGRRRAYTAAALEAARWR